MNAVSFDWELEEGEGSPPPSDGPGGGSRRRRWIVWGALLFVLVTIVGLAARSWIQGRIDAIKEADAALRDAVELELKTIADGDAELFRDRQDPGDARWRARQSARYIYKAEGFAPAPGLTPVDRPLEIKQVRVLGRTGRAELIHWFTAPSQSSGAPLPYHVTWFYRQDDNGNWYHVAPPDDYRGIPYSWYGSRLVIRAKEAEAKFLDPLARDLSILVTKGCRLLHCPEGTRYTLSFDAELAPRVADDWWIMPAIHLAGVPGDEEAQTAWEQGLTLWIAEALVQTQADGEDLGDRLIYRQLVQRFQARLGLLLDPEATLIRPDIDLLVEALLADRQHTFQDLWEAEHAANEPEEMRLLESEVALLLQWIEDQVGADRLFDLLSALRDHSRLDTALLATYQLAPASFEGAWLAYLIEMTGVPPPASALASGKQRLDPPPVVPAPLIRPGDDIAVVCDNRIWVSNTDGTNSVPLTASGEGFAGLHWSPDGRWLLTNWLPQLGSSRLPGDNNQRALYLVASDGSGGRLLTDDPSLSVWAIGWSPDGRQAVYYVWQESSPSPPAPWGINVGTGETSPLPGTPLWSPDGEHMIYSSEPFAFGSSVWLADGDWEDATQIADRAWIWPGRGWSPDGSQIALAAVGDGPGPSAVVIYDLTTEALTPLITAGELNKAVLSYEGEFLGDDTEASVLADKPLESVWVAGWSASGAHLLVWAQATDTGPTMSAPTVLAVVPVDGTPPRVLSFGRGAFVSDAPWSPTDPDRMTFAWSTGERRFSAPKAYLFDLEAGPVFTAMQAWNGAWSPDGAWVAFAGQGQVTVVDQAGRARFNLREGDPCSVAAWNPTADLSGLGVGPALVSSANEWGFANVHVYQDPETHGLHVMGELVNYTRDDRRVMELSSTLLDGDGNLIVETPAVVFSPDYGELTHSISLADRRSLPFGFTISLSESVALENDSQVLVDVEAEPAKPTRDDLEIPFDDFDLSPWPDRLEVRGIFDNPGPPLEEYLTVVVTAYDEGGRVIGWGWARRTDAAYLMSGGHYFEVRVPASQVAADLALEVGSYRVQLFAR